MNPGNANCTKKSSTPSVYCGKHLLNPGPRAKTEYACDKAGNWTARIIGCMAEKRKLPSSNVGAVGILLIKHFLRSLACNGTVKTIQEACSQEQLTNEIASNSAKPRKQTIPDVSADLSSVIEELKVDLVSSLSDYLKRGR